MRKVKIGTLALFFLALLLPLLAFRREPSLVSEIDNRMLAENPFCSGLPEGGDLTEAVEQYVRDRIGFRDEMILSYTVLNDKLFGKMVHPMYFYGKDGYVFSHMGNTPYGEYHEAFADMTAKLQAYCESRGVPFLFTFEPSKGTVLASYLPAGIHHNADWRIGLMAALEERGVRCVDNTPLLVERSEAGEAVFNRKYDAGHWNGLGAFYGVNHMLEALSDAGLRPNRLDEFDRSEVLVTSLPVSKFPIHEMVPAFALKTEVVSRTEEFCGEVRVNPSFPEFNVVVNPARLREGAPRTLVFQGSYVNGQGRVFFQNALGEYISVHNYQNVLDIDYYFNIFQPECVIFEATEYTFGSKYFDYQRMVDLRLNPALDAVLDGGVQEEACPLAVDAVTAEQGEALTVLSWNGGGDEEYAWLLLGGTFDLRRNEAGGLEATVTNEAWERNRENLQIAALAGDVLRVYG